jgi:DNA-binding NarL/FixJ family response regulator
MSEAQDLFSYPTQDQWKAAGTSAEAARLAAQSAPRLRARCMEVIRAAPAGLTADQVAERIGHDKCSIRARVSELYRGGQLMKMGRRETALGASANVWVAVDDEAAPIEQERKTV